MPQMPVLNLKHSLERVDMFNNEHVKVKILIEVNSNRT